MNTLNKNQVDLVMPDTQFEKMPHNLNGRAEIVYILMSMGVLVAICSDPMEAYSHGLQLCNKGFCVKPVVIYDNVPLVN